MKTMTVEQFRDAVRAQHVLREHYAFKCPMCATVQSAHDLIVAGAGPDFESVEKYLGFSCVGRFLGAKPPRKEPDGEPCNWTLGGLLQLHNLEILDKDGESYPHFEPATPEEAQAKMEKQQAAT